MSTYPVCPHCWQRIINPGGHAEACYGPRPVAKPEATVDVAGLTSRSSGPADCLAASAGPATSFVQQGLSEREEGSGYAPATSRSENPVQTELAPNHEIDPTTQVTRTPGVDAICQKVGAEGYAPDCGFPFCDCFVRGGS